MNIFNFLYKRLPNPLHSDRHNHPHSYLKRPCSSFLRISTLCGVVFVAACSNQQANSTDPYVDVVSVFSQARKPLFDRLPKTLDLQKPFIAASFVNIDDLSSSSTFGRMSAEMIAAGLTERGYQVKEVKMRDSLFIQQQAGEFILSRQLRDVSQSLDAQAILLGTYAVGGRNVYVSARLVRTQDNVVLGAYNFSLPINRDLKKLLKQDDL